MRVFVLGAGASKPAGFPLGKELMAGLRVYLDDVEHAETRSLGETWDRLFRDGIFREGEDAEANFTRLYLHAQPLRARAQAREPVEADGTVLLYTELPRLIDMYFMHLHHRVQAAPSRIEYLCDF